MSRPLLSFSPACNRSGARGIKSLSQCISQAAPQTTRRTFSAARCLNAPQQPKLQRTARLGRQQAVGSQYRTHELLLGCNRAGARSFTSTSPAYYKTVNEARSRYNAGPFSWVSGGLFLIAGVGMIIYFRQEKARMERKRIAEANSGVGRPKVGGPFELVDHNGQSFTEQNLKGKFALVYFGFTHCPDICPEELDKMADMIDLTREKCGNVLQPIFITCDPARDTPAVVKAYLKEFHPDIIGLTGTWEQTKAVCKAYRVYFSTPPNVKPGQDYLVDHSIYFYLMDPNGEFVEAIGRQHTAERAAKIIAGHVGDWKGPIDKS